MDADGDRSLLADGRVGDGPVAGGVVDGRDDHAVGLDAGGPGEADAGTGCRQPTALTTAAVRHTIRLPDAVASPSPPRTATAIPAKNMIWTM